MTDVNKKDDELLEGELPPALKAAIEKKKAKEMKNDDSEESDDDEKEKMMKEKKHAKMKEDIDAIFSGESLSEEFKNNAKAIFEAAIFAKVDEAVTVLEEEYATKLEAEVTSINENLVTKVDEYLEYVVTEWMEENKLAVEKGIKAELAEDFMIGLKNLFTEHYVDIPEDKVNVVEEFLREIPGVVPSIGGSVNNGNGGSTFVNLRGLGSNRNISLLNGTRVVPADLVGFDAGGVGASAGGRAHRALCAGRPLPVHGSAHR